MAILKPALVFFMYILNPTLYAATVVATAPVVPWLLFCSLISPIVLSVLAAHLVQDQNITMFQFSYWCISWGWLGWKILPSFPAFFTNSITSLTTISILVLVFADVLFFSIVSSTGGTGGRYTTLHHDLWERLQAIGDALTRRKQTIATEASDPPPPYHRIADFPSSPTKSSLSVADIIV